MKKILFSIVLPVYNAEKHVADAINSVINQDYKNWELIIVDDGSNDNSYKVIKKFLNDNRINYIYEKNSGVSAARNNALKHANGDYVLFIDSDDYFSMNILDDMSKLLSKKNVDVVKFGYFTERGVIRKKYKFSSTINQILEDEILKQEVKNNIFSSYDFNCVWNSVIKSNIAKSIQFDKKIINAEDLLYFYKVLKISKSIFITNEPYYHYIYNFDSVSHTKDIRKNIKKFNDLIYVYSIIEDDIGNLDECKSRIRKNLEELMLSIIDYSKGYNELIEILNANGFFDILQNNSKYFLNINLHDIYKYARVKKMIQKIKSKILKKI